MTGRDKEEQVQAEQGGAGAGGAGGAGAGGSGNNKGLCVEFSYPGGKKETSSNACLNNNNQQKSAWCNISEDNCNSCDGAWCTGSGGAGAGGAGAGEYMPDDGSLGYNQMGYGYQPPDVVDDRLNQATAKINKLQKQLDSANKHAKDYIGQTTSLDGEDLYILKSQIVPPVCPACPSITGCVDGAVENAQHVHHVNVVQTQLLNVLLYPIIQH